jgi:hypothetical protein
MVLTNEIKHTTLNITMKKIFALLSPAAIYLTATPYVFAADSVKLCPTGVFARLCNVSFSNFVPTLITLLFVLAILIAVVYLIWGGIKWIMSGGDKNALQTAREHVIAAILGLIIVFLVYFLLNLLLNWFGIITPEGGFEITPIDTN